MQTGTRLQLELPQCAENTDWHTLDNHHRGPDTLPDMMEAHKKTWEHTAQERWHAGVAAGRLCATAQRSTNEPKPSENHIAQNEQNL